MHYLCLELGFYRRGGVVTLPMLTKAFPNFSINNSNWHDSIQTWEPTFSIRKLKRLFSSHTWPVWLRGRWQTAFHLQSILSRALVPVFPLLPVRLSQHRVNMCSDNTAAHQTPPRKAAPSGKLGWVPQEQGQVQNPPLGPLLSLHWGGQATPQALAENEDCPLNIK